MEGRGRPGALITLPGQSTGTTPKEVNKIQLPEKEEAGREAQHTAGRKRCRDDQGERRGLQRVEEEREKM